MKRTIVGLLGIAWGAVMIWYSGGQLLSGSMGAAGYLIHALSVPTGAAAIFLSVRFLRAPRRTSS
jgi:hypothetical protein